MEHLKLNGIAGIIGILAIIILSVWILPVQKKTDQMVAEKYSKIAQQYDESTDQYKNMNEVNKLQSEISSIQQDEKIYKLISIGFISLFLLTITGILATWVQFIFTTLKFTGYDHGSSNYSVLAAALISSAIVVTAAFCLFFST